MGQVKSVLKIVTFKSLEIRPLGRPRNWLEDDIREILSKYGVNVWNWIDSPQGRDYSWTCACSTFYSKYIKYNQIEYLNISKKYLIGHIFIESFELLMGDCMPYPHNVNFRKMFLRN